jgi:hypothetical protein
MDFVGSLGGVNRVLLQMASAIFGGYATFWSIFSTNSALYKIKSDTKVFEKEIGDYQIIHVPLGERIAIFLHMSKLGPCLSCCRT